MLIVLTILALHVLAGSVVAARFCKPIRHADAILAALLTAFGTFYGLPIIIGWSTGRINTSTVVIATVVALACAAAAVWRDCASVPIISRIANPFAGWKWHEMLLCGLVCATLLLLLAIGSQLPIRIWDAAGYHALNPMRWAETHRFLLDSYGDPALDALPVCGEVYPNAKAVLPFLILDITNFERGTAIAQWPFLVVALCATYAVARRMQLGRSPAFAAAFFVLLAPEVIMQSVESYADIVFLAGEVAALWSIVLVWQDGARWKHLALASLAFAVLTSAKPTGLLTGGALGVALLIAILWGSERPAFRCRVARAVTAVVLITAVSLAIAGPWYLHGLLRYHNPVYPVRVAVGNRTIFPGPYESTINTFWSQKYGEAKGVSLWWKMMNESVPVNLAAWVGGLGAHATMLGLPASAAFIVFALATRRRGLYAPVLLACALMLGTTATLTLTRLVLFELVFMGIALGWVLSFSWRPGAALIGICYVLVLGYDVVRSGPSILYRIRPAYYVGSTLFTGQARAIEVDTFPDEYTALDFWREELSGPGKVLALPQSFYVWYARPLNRGASVVRVRNFEMTGNIEMWLADLRKAGATHVYVPQNSPAYRLALNAPAKLKPVFERMDSGAETSMFIAPSEEAAIFEILPGNQPRG